MGLTLTYCYTNLIIISKVFKLVSPTTATRHTTRGEGRISHRTKHDYYMRHLLSNIKKNFNELSIDVNWKFINHAKTYRIEEWESYMCMLDRENCGIWGFLEEVGHKNWARCHFNNRRYSMMTSNNAELMNAMNVNPRDFPITRLLEFLRGNFQQWFYKRREVASAVTLTVLAKTQEDNYWIFMKTQWEWR